MKKLISALIGYTLIGIAATYTLDGNFRVFLWIFIGGLALKTYVGYLQSK